MSTSSWGRELKHWSAHVPRSLTSRPLREVVSWNFKKLIHFLLQFVDLFVRSWVETYVDWQLVAGCISRPLREVVSWNADCTILSANPMSRPLREVVSWNGDWLREKYDIEVSTSSWGRELKLKRSRRRHGRSRRPLREVVSWNSLRDIRCPVTKVDLFVRSWVETY